VNPGRVPVPGPDRGAQTVRDEGTETVVPVRNPVHDEIDVAHRHVRFADRSAQDDTPSACLVERVGRNGAFLSVGAGRSLKGEGLLPTLEALTSDQR
jgi:hypothetical protein